MGKVYAVTFIYEGYDDMEYVEKVFGSMDSATAYVEAESMKLENPYSKYRIDEWEVE